LDTNVISAVAPASRNRQEAIAAWLDRMSDSLYLSVITAAEIRDGIAKAAREGASRKAADLTVWWDTVEHLYGVRILPFDLRAATIAGGFLDQARAAGRGPGLADVAIAAIAEARQLTILTRNTRDFLPFGVTVLDPFQALPPMVESRPDL
jgi:hypothetical protein